MTPPAPLTLDDVKFRSIYDDLTAAELALLEQGSEHWGGPVERAHRGALYLDRVMPDWYERVIIQELSLLSSCNCVLGQIFKSPLKEAERLPATLLTEFGYDSSDTSNEYTFAVRTLFNIDEELRSDAQASLYESVDDEGYPLLPPPTYVPWVGEFLGFDYDLSTAQGVLQLPERSTSWKDLTAAWRSEISDRVTAATAGQDAR